MRVFLNLVDGGSRVDHTIFRVTCVYAKLIVGSRPIEVAVQTVLM